MFLARGMRGGLVQTAQERLILRGFGVGALGADGAFGGDTENAVRAFQAAAALPVTGVVEDATWLKLGLPALDDTLRPAATPRITHYIEPFEPPPPVTSLFGMRASPLTGAQQHHNGLDIGRAEGRGFYALAAGEVKVVWSGHPLNGNGLVVEMDNWWRWINIHLHDLEPSVKVGQRVKAGQKVGHVGQTGAATGPHEHLMLEYYNAQARTWVAVDPLPYLLSRPRPSP